MHKAPVQLADFARRQKVEILTHHLKYSTNSDLAVVQGVEMLLKFQVLHQIGQANSNRFAVLRAEQELAVKVLQFHLVYPASLNLPGKRAVRGRTASQNLPANRFPA